MWLSGVDGVDLQMMTTICFDRPIHPPSRPTKDSTSGIRAGYLIYAREKKEEEQWLEEKKKRKEKRRLKREARRKRRDARKKEEE